MWTNAAVTYLTRPPGLAKLVVTRAEAEALVKANPFQRLIEAEDGPSDFRYNLLEDGNADRGYNAFWIDTANFLGNVKGEYSYPRGSSNRRTDNCRSPTKVASWFCRGRSCEAARRRCFMDLRRRRWRSVA